MVTANGDFDLAFGGQNASDSIVRMTLNGLALIVAAPGTELIRRRQPFQGEDYALDAR